MKKSSKKQNELEELKTAYENSRQVRKHAKAALKAEKKAIKVHLRPFRLAYKQAVQIEKETKELLKLIEKSEAKQETFSEKVGEAAKSKKVKGTQKKDKKARKPSKTDSTSIKETKETDLGTKVTTVVAKSVPGSLSPEDLTRIKGVGERVAEMLNENGISSFADMSATSEERFRQLLRDNNMAKFRNPANWAKEAAALIGNSKLKVVAPKKRGRPKVTTSPDSKIVTPIKKTTRKPRIATAKTGTQKRRGRPKGATAASTAKAVAKTTSGKLTPEK